MCFVVSTIPSLLQVIHASKLDESISSLPATSLTDTKHNQVHADPQSAHSSTNTSAPAPLQHVSQSGPRPVTVPFTKYVASVQQILVLSSGSSILPRSTSSLASSTASMYSLPHPTSSRSEPTLCLLRCDGPGSIQVPFCYFIDVSSPFMLLYCYILSVP